jgi:hypothetical protein
MADLYSQATAYDAAGAAVSTLGANTLTVDKTTRLGTPELTTLVVTGNEGIDYNNEGDWNTPNSDYSKAVRALQQWVEIYHIHEPDSGSFTVQVRASSVPLASDEALEDGDTNTVLSNAVSAALGETVSVWHATIDGDDIEYD